MATTRIMPLHIGKGRTESQAVSDIIDYVSNPQKTDNGRLVTGFACDSRVADAEFLLAKREYISTTGRVRGADDVLAYHVFHKELEEKLNEEQRGLLAQLLDAMENEHNCDAQSRFIRGYSLGVLMATEVMEERDKFLIEEDCIP